MEALMRRMIAAGPPANRPPHIGLASPVSARSCRSPRRSSGRGFAVLGGVAMSLLLGLGAAASAAEAPNNNITLGEFSPAATPHPAPEVAFTDIEGKPASL